MLIENEILNRLNKLLKKPLEEKRYPSSYENYYQLAPDGLIKCICIHGNLAGDTMDVVSCLKELPKLSSLKLSKNNIEDITPLKILSHLSELELSDNYISNISILKDFTDLTALDLSYNQITDIRPLKWMFLSGKLIEDIRSCVNSNSIKLKLHSNPIKVPRPSIMYKNNEAITAWFKGEKYIDNKNKKILSIDDSMLDLFIVGKILKNYYKNYNVISSQNPDEYLAIMTNWKPDLILLNLQMPVMDGFDVIQYMEDNNINIPTIMISSSINENDLTQAHNSPLINEFISKPLNSWSVGSIDRHIKKNEEEEMYDEAKKKTTVKDFDVGLTIVDNQLKLVKLYKDKRFDYLDADSNKYQLLHSYYESTSLKIPIEEFEYLINKHNVRESELQDFFERNPDFILNEDYKTAHPRYKLTLEDSKNEFFIPDFILEPYNPNALCDILDIKLPDVRIFTMKKHRVRYSSAVMEVCAQLREYAAYFEDSVNRTKVANKFHLNIYRPRMIAIIGRQKNIDPIQLKKVESDLPGLTLVTYDEVLEKMKRRSKRRQ